MNGFPTTNRLVVVRFIARSDIIELIFQSSFKQVCAYVRHTRISTHNTPKISTHRKQKSEHLNFLAKILTFLCNLCILNC